MWLLLCMERVPWKECCVKVCSSDKHKAIFYKGFNQIWQYFMISTIHLFCECNSTHIHFVLSLCGCLLIQFKLQQNAVAIPTVGQLTLMWVKKIKHVTTSSPHRILILMHSLRCTVRCTLLSTIVRNVVFWCHIWCPSASNQFSIAKQRGDFRLDTGAHRQSQ